MVGAGEERDRQWVEEIRGGDEQAFEELFRTYFEEFCSFAQYHVDAPGVAEALVQNVFCDLWDRGHSESILIPSRPQQVA